MGFSGGIWLLWDDSVDLEAITVNDQIINAIIKKEGRVQWLLSAIYASPKQAFREELWQYIRDIGSCIQSPWQLVGDFNQILSSDEKKGGKSINRRRASRM